MFIFQGHRDVEHAVGVSMYPVTLCYLSLP